MNEGIGSQTMKEHIIYLHKSNGQLKPVGLFYGELRQSQKMAHWVRRDGMRIGVVPTPSTDTGMRNKLSVLHSQDQTVFRVVPNQISVSVGFSGECGLVYYFGPNDRLIVRGKLKVDDRGNVRTYSGQHSICIDGTTSILIQDGLVTIKCRNGSFYLDQNLPIEMRAQMNVLSPERPKSSLRRTVSELTFPTSRPEPPPSWSRVDTSDSYYLFPNTFFGEPLDLQTPDEEYADNLRRCYPESPQTSMAQESGEWTQQRNQFRTQYMPSTYFDDQLPTASHTRRPNMVSALRRTFSDPNTRRERDTTGMFHDSDQRKRKYSGNLRRFYRSQLQERDKEYSNNLRRFYRSQQQERDEDYHHSLRRLFPEKNEKQKQDNDYYHSLRRIYSEKTGQQKRDEDSHRRIYPASGSERQKYSYISGQRSGLGSNPQQLNRNSSQRLPQSWSRRSSGAIGWNNRIRENTRSGPRRPRDVSYGKKVVKARRLEFIL